MEVLFTLLAQRYERGSVMITSKLPFSQGERIFKDPMTTAAAIDRARASRDHPGVESAQLPPGGLEAASAAGMTPLHSAAGKGQGPALVP